MTVFSLSSIVLGIVALAIEEARRKPLQIVKGSGNMRGGSLLTKSLICLPSRLRLLRMNHCIRHCEGWSLTVSASSEGCLFGSYVWVTWESKSWEAVEGAAGELWIGCGAITIRSEKSISEVRPLLQLAICCKEKFVQEEVAAENDQYHGTQL